MHYSGIIFDFNGTLFFDTNLHVKAWDTISMRLTGKHITLDTIVKKYWGLKNTELISRLTNNRLSATECEKLSAEKEELYRSYVKNTPEAALAPGAESFFNHLKKHGIPFTIASASIKANIDFYVQQFQLSKWIDPATIVYDDGSYRNKFEMYIEAAKRINRSENLLIFEDSINGIMDAGKTQAKVIGIKSDALQARQHEIPFVCAMIEDFKDIVLLLEQLPD